MQIKHLLFICCLLSSLTTFASNVVDSIGVENSNNKKVILHKVEPKENYYSIARKYQVSPKTVIELNGIKNLQIGAIVKVPTDLPYVEEKAAVVLNTATANKSADLIDYKVGAKETLYAISRKFNMSIDELKSVNNLKNTSLSIGQIIKVKYGSSTADQYTPPSAVLLPATDKPKSADTTTTDSIRNAGDRLRVPAKYGLTEVDEHGIALTIDDPNVDATKMLALHKTAPIGTIIKITNPMTNKSTFTKIVGTFAENDNTKDAIIIVTKAAATLLGALDQRFQVSIVYGIRNEE